MRIPISIWIRCYVLAWLFQIYASTLVTGREHDVNRTTPTSSIEDLVRWDKYSPIIRNERVFLFSGEFHPWRLPSPGLWVDIFQKIKAMGFNAVSFYVYWGLVEGKRGEVRFDGVFALDEFFRAASEAGIYLIARPGPYINAEVAAGGLPGWTLRIKDPLRGNGTEWLESIETYTRQVGKIIADAQITNGGPVVMVQVENEYDTWPGVNDTDFPTRLNRDNMVHTQALLRKAGIVVPLMHNDHLAQGNWAPGSGPGAVDIYAIDAYPLRYDCGNPDIWPTYRFPRDWHKMQSRYSPDTPFFVAEFQGGASNGFGTSGQDGCNALINQEAVRVLWKNNYSFAIKLFNVYMTYGGTNWGNMGYMGGDSSYDYGAAIKENRHVWREKYSEQKLQANFFKVSPAYLTAVAGDAGNGSWVDTGEITVTLVYGTEEPTRFWIVRHADFTSKESTTFRWTAETKSRGNVTVGQELLLSGRDSKVMVTDYDVGGINLLYCTADIFTWQRVDKKGKRTLILYGGAGESHVFALELPGRKDSVVHQWQVKPTRQIVRFDGVDVLLLWRNDAYNYWVLELPAPEPIGNHSSPSKSSVIISGGYLLRTASISGSTLHLIGDINATTTFELIHDPTGGRLTHLTLNNRPLPLHRNAQGLLTTDPIPFSPPPLSLPDFRSLTWHHHDSLPEVSSLYSDALWPSCILPANQSTNPTAPVTLTSLYISDYGFHSGTILYRGHFVSTGTETSLSLTTSGGFGHAYSAWLNSTFLKSWDGGPPAQRNKTFTDTLPFPLPLEKGKEYVITVVLDTLGQDEEAPGTDAVKFPLGILDYSLSGRRKDDVDWKVTGNLGGEDYRDKERGPKNEGGLWAERMGYHLPGATTTSSSHMKKNGWTVQSPLTEGIQAAGIGVFVTTFELQVPEGWDIPMNVVFGNGTTERRRENYRVQLFVNGWQMGKYVANLGPQSKFPVPEGILNHNGPNTVAITLWSLDERGAKLASFTLEPEMPVWSGYRKPWMVHDVQKEWEEREEVY